MTILMIAVIALVLLGVVAYLSLRGPVSAAPVVEVRQVPKTLGEVLVFGVVERWGERLKASLEKAAQ